MLGVFLWGVQVYGFEVGVFLCGGVWFFWWLHRVGLDVGLSVGLGLRYRLLWSWVLRGCAWLENGNGIH